MARCLLHVGLEMELASIVGWFPVWLVSRVVGFPCECVVLTLSLIASGVESIVLKLGSMFEQKIPAAYVTFPENESNAPPVLLV
jgi:hypothetical protein